MRGALDEVAGGAHPVARPVGELRGGTFDGHGPDVVNGQVVAREADRRPLRHDASLGRSTLRRCPTCPQGVSQPPTETVPPDASRGRRGLVASSCPRRSLSLVRQEPQLKHM